MTNAVTSASDVEKAREKAREGEGERHADREEREKRERERVGIDRPTEIQRESETREAMCVLVSNTNILYYYE